MFHARGEITVTGTSTVTFHYDPGSDSTARRTTLGGLAVDLPPHAHFEGQFAELAVESVTP
ncbi:MAG: hypothetical protein H6Q90_5959 [Deltaproteobacteria bacterium]|nr:hypothetical protein [Deltaproteobacteria bacterium]